MTKLEQFKLNYYRGKFGDMSSDEALICALGDEQIQRDCGSFDPVAGRFAQRKEEMINYAELLEKDGK